MAISSTRSKPELNILHVGDDIVLVAFENLDSDKPRFRVAVSSLLNVDEFLQTVIKTWAIRKATVEVTPGSKTGRQSFVGRDFKKQYDRGRLDVEKAVVIFADAQISWEANTVSFQAAVFNENEAQSFFSLFASPAVKVAFDDVAAIVSGEIETTKTESMFVEPAGIGLL